MVDLRQQLSDAIDHEWIDIASRLPWSTPDHVTESLRLAYLEAIRDDGVNTVFDVREYWVNGRAMKITARVRPHVVEAFARQAIELASIKPRTFNRLPVYLEDVPRLSEVLQ